MLEISLFDTFDARRDGVSLCSRWLRHTNRILALLTLNHNRPINSDWITAALMLPDGVLPNCLVELYSVLGEDRARIQHGNRQVCFDTRDIRVDSFEFDRLIQQNTQESLRRAVDLYGGGLLKDWEEESWFNEEREACLANYLEAINTLAKSAIAEGDYDLAASYRRRYVNAYPEMDSGWARLIEVYGLAGNPTMIEKARARYLEALETRSREAKRALSPSGRVLRTCEEALQRASQASAALAALREEAGAAPLSSTTRAATTRAATTRAADASDGPLVLEPAGGAVPLESPYYLARPADELVFAAIERRDSFILIKGPRQVGKSSLLTRVLHRAQATGAQVVRTDWQKIAQSCMESARSFLLDLTETFVDALELDSRPAAYFESDLSPTKSFERFLRRDVLAAVPGSLVWIVDEADRLFECAYRDDVFALLRSWHNERANDFSGRWRKLTVVMAYATEAYLFIENLNQSPFNIGSRFELDDFTREQVEEMNRRYGNPVTQAADMACLYALVGGHPYLVRRCLQEMILQHLSLADIEASVRSGTSLFDDHLSRMRLAAQRDPAMIAALRALLSAGTAPGYDLFIRLRAAGVMRGSSPESLQPRCGLYDTYLRKALL
jgi:DNA-binding SARP family transcriptional activator